MAPTATSTGIRSIGYVIVFVRDMQRSTRFYRDLVGLTVKNESPHWTEFDLGGTTLALHGVEDYPPAPQPAADPSAKKGVAQEIVFQAADPLAVREALEQRGIRIAKPKMVHEAGPTMVGVSCLFEDPDGNTLSVYGVIQKSAFEKQK